MDFEDIVDFIVEHWFLSLVVIIAGISVFTVPLIALITIILAIVLIYFPAINKGFLRSCKQDDDFQPKSLADFTTSENVKRAIIAKNHAEKHKNEMEHVKTYYKQAYDSSYQKGINYGLRANSNGSFDERSKQGKQLNDMLQEILSAKEKKLSEIKNSYESYKQIFRDIEYDAERDFGIFAFLKCLKLFLTCYFIAIIISAPMFMYANISAVSWINGKIIEWSILELPEFAKPFYGILFVSFITAILTALSIPLIYGASLYYSIYKKTTIYDGFSSSKEEVKEVVLQPTEETPPVQEISKQSPVNIRDIILDALDIDYLKSCLDDLELEADRRSYDSMIDVIRNNKNATAEYLLSDLYVTQIKDICEKVGISSKKKKYELIEVLIQLEREQANVG